jgi:hypothetical protein
MLTYKEHYLKSIGAYGSYKVRRDIYAFDYEVIKENSTLVTLDKDYPALAQNAARLFAALVEDEGNLWIPSDPSAAAFALRLESLDHPEFKALANYLIPQLEKNLFGSYCILEGTYAYRNLHTESPLRSSWKWHYDNNPKEIIKIMVYLSDVDDDSAPFQILSKDNMGSKGVTTKVDHKKWAQHPRGSRIQSEELAVLDRQGYKPVSILGGVGTTVVFDNNIIHRATVPAPGKYRDVICFMVRPWHEKIDCYISTSGAWTDRSILKDPEDANFWK